MEPKVTVPKIVVKVRRPSTDEQSDSEFEILSDCGNEDVSSEETKGYERLEEMEYHDTVSENEYAEAKKTTNALQAAEKIKLSLSQQQLNSTAIKREVQPEVLCSPVEPQSQEALERSTRFVDRLNLLLSVSPKIGGSTSSVAVERLSDSTIGVESLHGAESERKLSEPGSTTNELIPYRTMSNLAALE